MMQTNTNSLELESKVVIITGGAQGIGRQTCKHFAKHGAIVICLDLNRERGQDLEKEWKNEGKGVGAIEFVELDVSNGEQCKSTVENVFRKYQRIDVLFNNAGIQPKESNVPIHLLEENVWDKVLDVNLKSIFFMCKYTIPHMINAKKGAIVNNSSIQGINSQRGVPVYSASKGAILSLTRQLAVEYGRYNIRVNAVSPGSIMTDLARENNKSFPYVVSNTPMGVLGEPGDVADLVLFLSSDRSKWVTGQNYVVDGGITIKGGWASLDE